MNTEQFKQSWGQLEGHLKKHWGKLTDDDLLQIEGDLDKFDGATLRRDEGSGQQVGGSVVCKVERVVCRVLRKMETSGWF